MFENPLIAGDRQDQLTALGFESEIVIIVSQRAITIGCNIAEEKILSFIAEIKQYFVFKKTAPLSAGFVVGKNEVAGHTEFEVDFKIGVVAQIGGDIPEGFFSRLIIEFEDQFFHIAQSAGQFGTGFDNDGILGSLCPDISSELGFFAESDDISLGIIIAFFILFPPIFAIP